MNIETLQRYIDDKIQESLHLDYKASLALQKNKRDEIAKDVSAMANSDGGIIIYGIKEKAHLPEKLDDGVSNIDISKEWLEQILQSNISPKLPDIRITPIEASNSSTYYVLDIPKSHNGPHQAPDKKYYKRYNFNSAPMDNYEIVDIQNRKLNVTPLVSVTTMKKQDEFYIVVENFGDSPAENVSFQFSESMNWKNTPYIFENEVRYLSPGSCLSFLYKRLSFTERQEEETVTPVQFKVTANYFHPELNKVHSETFICDFRNFISTHENNDTFIQNESLLDISRNIHELTTQIRMYMTRKG